MSRHIGPWVDRVGRRALAHRCACGVPCGGRSGASRSTCCGIRCLPYQREGMLHLAFTERALLADEMGLGKTIQAIAACALLAPAGQGTPRAGGLPGLAQGRMGGADRPFTDVVDAAGVRSASGTARGRTRIPAFFTIVNYEQMIADALDINARSRPDIVVLDEAQRIKNWNTKTAQAVKRCAAATPSCSPARRSRTASTSCIR